MALYSSTGIPNYASTLGSSPDAISSFFNSANVSMGGVNEWDWSNNLIDFPSAGNNTQMENNLTTVQVTPSLSPPTLSPTSSEHAPSPPTISSTPSPTETQETQPATTRKRRKREINLSPEMYNIGFEWSHYNSPASTFQIYDTNTMQNITHQFDIVTHKVESNTHFSPADNAWICYRQNQFKVVCFLKCPQPQQSMSISDSGVPKEIHQLCVKLYAIKEMSTLISDEVRVGMHHVGRARVKKEKQEISLTPFVNGRVEFANVQFEKSNSVKGQQLEYFRLIMAFYAKSGNNYFHIFSKQSPRLIVRSQNPGFYGDTTFAYMGVMPVPGVVPGVVPGSVVPEATIKTAGRTGSVTGGVGIAGAAPVGISGGTVPNMVGSDSPSGEKDGSSLPPLVGVKRNASEEYGDNSYQVPTNNFDSATNTETLNAMNFDSASETDYLLNRSAQEGWKKREGEGSMVYKGKVGINVANPSEALTVKGNVLVHGDVFKPSDMRIKSEITPVESGEQLAHIRELKLYDYTVNQKKERGVLAQELQQVMPNAVREVGDVVVDSKVIKNMLTVNERALLYENIGATKQLDKEVESGKQTIVHINTKVDDLAVSTRAHNDSVQGTVQSMFALFFQEEDKKGTHNGLEEEFVSFGFSLFRMGPARTLLVLGHFIPWIWFIGAMFTFSNLIRRRVLGCICLFLFGCFFTLLACQYFGSVDNIDTILIRARIAWAGVGAVLLIVNYFRLRRKLEQAALSKRS